MLTAEKVQTLLQCVVCGRICACSEGDEPSLYGGAVYDLRGRPFCSDGCYDEFSLRIGLSEAR